VADDESQAPAKRFLGIATSVICNTRLRPRPTTFALLGFGVVATVIAAECPFYANVRDELSAAAC
jgi:hypothetical protein